MPSITDRFYVAFKTDPANEPGEITVMASTPMEAVNRLEKIFPGHNLTITEMRLVERR